MSKLYKICPYCGSRYNAASKELLGHMAIHSEKTKQPHTEQPSKEKPNV